MIVQAKTKIHKINKRGYISYYEMEQKHKKSTKIGSISLSNPSSDDLLEHALHHSIYEKKRST